MGWGIEMSDLVKRLREHAHWGMTEEAADRIEQLEQELDSRRDVIIGLHDKIAAEKALADRLIVAGSNAIQNYTLFIKKFSDDWDAACAAYRKARGM